MENGSNVSGRKILASVATGHRGAVGVSHGSWHVLRDGPRLTLARRLPARFDVAAETHLPMAGRLRVAQQIRQDMWRAIQRQRGFSPVVEVTSGPSGLVVRAGGRIDAVPFDRARLEARISGVLEAPENRARWMRGAGGSRK